MVLARALGIKTTIPADATHHITVGGMLRVLQEHASQLRNAIAQPMNFNCVSELAGGFFRMFLELDPPEKWADNLAENNTLLIKLVCKTVNKIGGSSGADFLIYVSTKEDNSPGLHIVVPEFCVDVTRMLVVCSYLKWLLQREAQFSFVDDWEDFIDTKVYKGTPHMRMNFCYTATKHVNCPQALKYKKDDCGKLAAAASEGHVGPCPPTCKEGFIYNKARFYRVESVHHSSTGERDCNEEVRIASSHVVTRVEQLERTSIRHPTEELTEPFLPPIDCPVEINESSALFNRRYSAATVVKTLVPKTMLRGLVHPDDAIFKACQSLINEQRPWRHTKLASVIACVEENSLHVKYVMRPQAKTPGATFCYNRAHDPVRGKCHKTSLALWEAAEVGVQQLCRAGSKTTNRVVNLNREQICCLKFRSAPTPIGIEKMFVLWAPALPMLLQRLIKAGMQSTDLPHLPNTTPLLLEEMKPLCTGTMVVRQNCTVTNVEDTAGGEDENSKQSVTSTATETIASCAPSDACSDVTPTPVNKQDSTDVVAMRAALKRRISLHRQNVNWDRWTTGALGAETKIPLSSLSTPAGARKLQDALLDKTTRRALSAAGSRSAPSNHTTPTSAPGVSQYGPVRKAPTHSRARVGPYSLTHALDAAMHDDRTARQE
jgi:hypothetical protein